jgi:glycosyltransferase involved in cell wall biosynthesis
LIRQLSDRCEVSLLAFTFDDREEAGVEVMRQYCRTVETVRYRRQPVRKHLPGLVKRVLCGQPPANHFVFRPEFAAKLRWLTAEQHFDVVQIDCTPMAPYREFIADPHTRSAIVFIDVNAHKFRRMLRHERSAKLRAHALADWLLMAAWEARYAQRFDVCVMMSEIDAERIRRRHPRLNAVVVPNGVDVRGKQPLPESDGSTDLLFIGTLSHRPWADAVRHFHNAIFPHVRQAVPQARMVIVGEAPPPIRALASEDVVVAGWVDDVESFYRQCAASVVPLRAGGGTRLKILESLAYGRPVVSTTVGCEGLDLLPGCDLLVADEPGALAEQIIRVLTDSGLRRRLIRHGRFTVEHCHSWEQSAGKLLAAYERLCAGTCRARPEVSLGSHAWSMRTRP